MNDGEYYKYAEPFIKGSEDLALHAYPDPRSPLGKALVARHGANILRKIGIGAAQVDADLLVKSGDPWTIGWGQTGKDIRHGTVWTKNIAETRFRQSVAMFFERACVTWPGMKSLKPKTQAALVSLGFNRGLDLTKKADDPIDRRREMRDLRAAVAAKNYFEIARLLRSMKRIWENENMGGLIKRREDEACLVDEDALETR